MVRARFFDVWRGHLRIINIPCVLSTLRIPERRLYSATIIEPSPYITPYVREFTLGYSPLASKGIYDYYAGRAY